MDRLLSGGGPEREIGLVGKRGMGGYQAPSWNTGP
jgi:hypothetical protein